MGTRHGWGIAASAALLCACVDVHITPGDAGGARDAGPAIDAGADAGTADAGVDAGRTLLFEELFDTDPFASASPRWTPQDPTSWHWDSTEGRLASGPRMSCRGWTNSGTPQVCTEGPAIVHSPDFVMPSDGRLTIEVDMRMQRVSSGRAALRVHLRWAGGGDPDWMGVDPVSGAALWGNRAALVKISMTPLAARHYDLCDYYDNGPMGPSCFGFDAPAYTETRYRFHVELCGTRGFMRVTDLDSMRVVDESVVGPADLDPPSSFDIADVMITSENTDDSVDNIRVWAGADCAP